MCDVGESKCSISSKKTVGCIAGLSCATGMDAATEKIITEQAIPGLYGYADSYHINKAYCYNPNYRKLPEVVNKGASACTTTALCAAGEGGCTADTGCKTGLKCMLMVKDKPHTVPGFNFNSATITGEVGFCYDPKWIESHRMMASAPTGKCAASAATGDSLACGVGEGPCTTDTTCD